MGMRPADLQNIISRTHDVERVQRVSEESSRLQQIAFATELLRRKEREGRQVNESPQAEGGKIREKPEERNSEGRNSEGRNPERKNPEGRDVAGSSPKGKNSRGESSGGESPGGKSPRGGGGGTWTIDVEV